MTSSDFTSTSLPQDHTPRTTLLTRVTKSMRDKGASDDSIHTALTELQKMLQSATPSTSPQFISDTLLSDIHTKPLTWLWEQRIPLGHLTYLDGDPGVGKSLFALTRIARRTGCAIVFIRPSHSRSPDILLPRTASSRLLIAVARTVLLLIPDPSNEHHLLLLSTKHNLSPCPTTLTCQITSSEQGIPTIHCLGASPTSVSTLQTQPLPLSLERQHILQVLQNSPIPLAPQEIAERTGQDYTTLRQTLRRMHAAHELISPARGLYTTLTYPLAIIESVSQLSQISDTSNDPSDLPQQTPSQSSQQLQPSQTVDPSSDLPLQLLSQLSQTVDPVCDFPLPSPSLPPTDNLSV